MKFNRTHIDRYNPERKTSLFGRDHGVSIWTFCGLSWTTPFGFHESVVIPSDATCRSCLKHYEARIP